MRLVYEFTTYYTLSFVVEKVDFRGLETSTNQHSQTSSSTTHHASKPASPKLLSKVCCIVQSAYPTDRLV